MLNNAELLDWLILNALISFFSILHILYFPSLYSTSSRYLKWFNCCRTFPEVMISTFVDVYISLALWRDASTFNSLTFFFCFRDVWLIAFKSWISFVVMQVFLSPAPFPDVSVALPRFAFRMSNLWHHMWFHSNKLNLNMWL